MNNKTIIICADDYGFNNDVSEGIINLVKKGRITATSCMTNMPSWQDNAGALLNLTNKIDIGLHFNLTDGDALSKAKTIANQGKLSSLKRLILKAYTHQLSKADLKAELRAQIVEFQRYMKVLPDFIDGHQHVQQLPIVREAIVEVYKELHLEKNKTYVRVSLGSSISKIARLKTFIIRTLGARQLKKLLKAHNIPHNSSFSGVYDFSKSEDYAKHFDAFQDCLQNNGILMCHPGNKSSDSNDTIRDARKNEYDFYQSDEYRLLRDNKNVKISCFRHETL